MKKIICCLILTVICTLIFALPCFAQESDNEYREMYDSVSDSTKELLEQAGVYDVDFESLISMSPRKIIDLLLSLIKGDISQPLGVAAIIVSLIIISSVFRTVSSDIKPDNNVISFISSVIIISVIIIPVSQAMSAAASAVKLVADFMLGYIPVFTGIISASGQPLSAFTYSGTVIAFAQLLSKSAQLVLIPLVSVMTAINIFSAVSENRGLAQVTKTVKKIITVSLTVVAGVFSGLLALKGSLAVATDNVAVKGIKLLSGSVIPFIGGAVGEAYNSVLGSLSLIKSTVGVFGIVAVVITILPSVVNMLVWYFVLSLLSVVASITGDTVTNNTLESVMSCISLVNIVLVLTSVVFIVSTGIMLSFRG